MAIFEMGGSKASRSDGFPDYFFQSLWEIISKDIVQAVHEFQTIRTMPKDVNLNFIALIPKDIDDISFGKYRPISLCNILYKIILKVLENWLKAILS